MFLILLCSFSVAGADVFDPPKSGKLLSVPANLRSGPSLSDPVVGRVEDGEPAVEVLERRDSWVKIRAGDLEGWIFQALVAVEKDARPSAAPPSAAAADKAPPAPEAEPPPPAPVRKAPAAEGAAPGQAPEVAVMIREVVFSGNTVIDAETLQKAVGDDLGRELTLEEMSELVDRITIAYQEKGYILARAYLPKQDVTDGVLRIAVMEGNIGNIEVAGKTHYDEKLVKKYFEAQLAEGVVQESALEKGLLLTNELPDLTTNVLLRRGEEAGDVDVVVNTEDTARMTLGVEMGFDYNNFGSKLTSQNRYGTTIRLADHQYGTITDLRLVVGDQIKESFLGAGNFSVPVGSHGTKASVGYLFGNYIVGQDFADLGLDGYTQILGVNATHPVVKKRNRNLDVTLGFDYKYTKNFILDQERSIDEIGVAYAALSFDSLDRFLGKNIFNASFSVGQVSRDEQLAPSRIDIDQLYQRLNVSYARVQKLFGYTNLFLRASGQFSDDRLLPIEQFVIGGYGTVRGYDPALYLGDSGYTLTAELMIPPPGVADETIKGIRLAELLQFALFYDDGGVSLNVPQAGEFSSKHLSGWGGGFRIFYKDRFYFKYDVGFPLLPIPEQDAAYHYVQFGYQLF